MKAKVATILVWWDRSKVHVVREGSRTKCGILYRFDRGHGCMSQQWGLKFGSLDCTNFPPKVQGCYRCCSFLPAGFDF